MRRREFNTLFIAGALSLAAKSASAQAYPDRPVTVIVPFAAGGAVDVVARLLATHLSARLGQQFVIENRAGAGGNIAAAAVARAQADGYTLFVTSPGPLAINQFLYRQIAFDPARDFTPIALIARNPSILVVHPDFPAKTPREWIDAVKARSGGYNYASSGNGTSGHIIMELLKRQLALQITHVPYRGAAPASADLVAGIVPMTIDSITSVAGLIAGGQVRPIAVTAASRWPGLPNVATFAESGVDGFDLGSWIGLVGPASMPAAIVRRIADESRAFASEPSVRERLAALGAIPSGSGPEEFDAFIRAQRDVWRVGVEASGARIE